MVCTMFLTCLMVLCVFFNVGNGQICRKRSVVTKSVLETYQYSYSQRYSKKNWYGRTVYKTRMQFAIDTRPVQKQEIEFVPTCCDGYIRTDNGSLTDIECTPICMPACENGQCTSPGECVCNEGYLEDPGSPHKCLPVCGNCIHGTCVAPNVCRCDYGYSMQNATTCQPICSEPCVNSTCIAPDTCQCLDGFRKTEGNICTPYCSRGCWHGTCTEPETCTCDEGWHKYATDECVPKCDIKCGNGSCTEPNHCECNAGYKVDGESNPICVPNCDMKCGNGTCTAPNHCECNVGYKVDRQSNPICVPNCDIECGNGTCVAPNKCECKPGYNVDKNKEQFLCVPQCEIECGNGSCTAPNNCECNTGYELVDDSNPPCVPHCDIECGNGSCIAPNMCNCLKGYKLNKDKEPSCIPDCGNCEGNCVLPGKCECNEPYKATRITADGDECINNNDKCTHTFCRIDATVKTSEDNISYGYDDIETHDTVKLKSTMNTKIKTEHNDDSEYYDYDTVSVLNNSSDQDMGMENQIQGSEHLMQSKWGYAVISMSVIILAIILGSLVIFRKSITKWCTGSSYVVEDDKSKDGVSPENNPKVEMRLSTILKRRELDSRSDVDV